MIAEALAPHPRGVPSGPGPVKTCPGCGIKFQRPGAKFCSDPCRWRVGDQRRATDPERIAYVRQRNAARYGPAHRQPWALAAPPFATYLPGAGFSIDFRPQLDRMLELRHAYLLHGVLTKISGKRHDPLHPGWALLPWPGGSGWAIFVWDTDLAQRLEGLRLPGRIGQTRTEIRFGLPVRIKTPQVPRGRRQIELAAVTPVCCRSNTSSGTTLYTAPTAQTIRNSLLGALVPRLGLSLDPETVRIEMVSRETSPATVSLGSKYGAIRGWTGTVVVEANAPGRWLLEVAARGPGLGGRTALGFGRVRVSAP